MGILDDNDYGISDDPFKPKKTDSLFNMDFNLDKYSRGLNDTIGATGGGEGGALPNVGKTTFKVDTSNFGQPQLESVTEMSMSTAPAVQPVKPVKVQTPGYGQAKQKSDSDTDALFKAFSKLVPPDLQNTEDTASLGLKIQKTATVNPGPSSMP